MFIFVVYAIAVWFAAFRWRRRFLGIAIIVLSLVLLAFFNLMHYRVAAYFSYEALLPVFRVLMYPYMVFVGGLGLYLFSFPRELRRDVVQCRACWYDLDALVAESGESARCPECGATRDEARTRRGRRAARRRRHAISRVAPPVLAGLSLTPQHAEGDAHHERHER